MKTNKELKEDYKQMKFKMGVFQIRNTINEKIFIGSSVNLDAIWNRHRMQLNGGLHPNQKLQSEWNEFGEGNFIYEILSEITQKEDTTDYTKEVKELEGMYIDELKPYDENGYNTRAKSKLTS